MVMSRDKTTAEHFCGEVEAFLYLRGHGKPVPDIISPSWMRARYFPLAVEVKEDGQLKPRELVFADGSIATRQDPDLNRWKA